MSCENLGLILNISWVIVNFVWKFPNFCYHSKRDCLTQISLTQLNWRTPKPPIWCKNLGDMSYTSWVMADFVSKWRQLVAMATRWSNRNLNDTVWLPDPENAMFGANILHASLTVPELWLFKVAIGPNANFHILGLKGPNFNFSSSNHIRNVNATRTRHLTFKPLTTIIGPTGGPVAMRMKLKKNKNLKNRRRSMTTSRMRRQTNPFGPTDLNFCNCAKFFENRFRGSGAGRHWKMAFPIESVHRPYNSAVLHYHADCDMKSHMGFRLAPRSMTLYDLELQLSSNFRNFADTR